MTERSDKRVRVKEMPDGKEKKRRAWVKPAAIVFFIILFLLTFFSNTIMNYSMAEVEMKKAKAGTISASIRGSGVVSASDTYDVTLRETREIEEVWITVGDTIEAGEILFILDDSEGTELKEAQAMLDDLELQYQEALLSADSSNYSAEKSNIAQLEQDLADAKRERSAYGSTSTTVSAATEAVRIANIEVDELTAKKTKLETELEALEEGDSGIGALKSQISQVSSELESADSKLRSTQSALENATNIAAADSAVKAAEQALSEANHALEEQIQTDTTQAAISDLNMDALLKKIEDQRETVAKLTEKSVGTELIAEYGGIVTAVNVKA